MLFHDSRHNRHSAHVRSVRNSCIITKYCSRLFIDAIRNNWTTILYFADNYELAEDSYGGEAD